VIKIEARGIMIKPRRNKGLFSSNRTRYTKLTMSTLLTVLNNEVFDCIETAFITDFEKNNEHTTLKNGNAIALVK